MLDALDPILLSRFQFAFTFKHQPAKVAAMEGLWETQKGAPLKLFGWPDQEAGKTRFSLEIPHLSSLIITHEWNGEVKGLKAWPKHQRPPAASEKAYGTHGVETPPIASDLVADSGGRHV
jgi:cytochrome bd-type quinol oxidase subunit 1